MVRVVAILLLIPVAGCLSDEPVTGPRSHPAGDDTWDPDSVNPAVDWWEDFSTRWIKRDANTPMAGQVAEYLASEMEAAGFTVETRDYPGALSGVEFPDQPLLRANVVVGIKEGTDLADHRIGLVAHFDTQLLTFQGAYDDASGVAAQWHVCKAAAELELRRTVACIFFDTEEQGLVSSQQYVQDVILEGDESYVYDYVIGYDMTGINWPGHEWSLYVMTGGDEYVPILGDFARELFHGRLGFPVGEEGGRSGVAVLDTHDRNSDERRFRDVGVPIYRFAGGRHAADYPQYHMPQDTVEYVYDFVDGRANFEQGFGMILRTSHELVKALDRDDPAAELRGY